MFLRFLQGKSANLSAGFHRVETDADVLWKIQDEYKRQKGLGHGVLLVRGRNPFGVGASLKTLYPE
jgi:hypothetical protein